MESTISKPNKSVPKGISGTQSIRVQITNVYDGNDYSAQIMVGSQQVPVNVIMDTGSSTLAVSPAVYKAANDTHLKPGTYAQLVTYGTGGWAGPVINTSLSMGVTGNTVSLQNAPIAITDVQQKNNFVGVGGILGLAYNSLNDAFDFKAYLAKNNSKSPFSYPWPFHGTGFSTFSKKFMQLIKSNKVPQTDIVPYFTELEQNGVIANKFAFYTLRSWVHYATADKSNVAGDPLNNGFFILGGGEEQTDLYTGDFVNVQVLHDVYYNTNLKAVQVDGCPAVKALPLQADYVQFMISNSIIDSGTSDLALSNDVYQAILNSLKSLNPKFIDLINEAAKDGIAASKLDLASWPNINFILSGETGEDITLTCSPQTYWQVNFPAVGQAVFQVQPLGEDVNQSILGLPLMNNYYTVFDRSLDTNGVIRLAPVKQPSSNN